ncbi:hypothetical protein CCYA_CCYA10G2820 [Cyanidiococcus yangmingshanensis]|nr:hypothetical protein CCYA_CCYA10G2820 [Cyanidiococcus yangmingshanensis]
MWLCGALVCKRKKDLLCDYRGKYLLFHIQNCSKKRSKRDSYSNFPGFVSNTSTRLWQSLLRAVFTATALATFSSVSADLVFATSQRSTVQELATTEGSQALNREIELKFTQALQLTERGAWEEAESAWSAVLDLDPENGAALSNRGLVRISLNRLDDALADLQRAVRLSPDEPVLHENLGTIYEARNDWDAALREYGTVLQLEPNNATALLSRGNVHISRGEYPAALADYEAAASAETGLVASREKMALVMAQLGRSDESIQVLRQVVRKYPAYAEAHAALAAVLWGARHDYLGAEDQWARIQNDDMRDQLSDRETLRGYLRWPPRMIQYLNDFLNLRTASGEIESAGFVP